jgi:hypothetical protein
MDTVKITKPITVGVKERDGVYLIYDSGFPPHSREGLGRGHVGEWQASGRVE